MKHWLKGWGLVIRGGMVAGFQVLPENSGALPKFSNFTDRFFFFFFFFFLSILTIRHKNSKKLGDTCTNDLTCCARRLAALRPASYFPRLG